jgi:hypothetical protein
MVERGLVKKVSFSSLERSVVKKYISAWLDCEKKVQKVVKKFSKSFQNVVNKLSKISSNLVIKILKRVGEEGEGDL